MDLRNKFKGVTNRVKTDFKRGWNWLCPRLKNWWSGSESEVNGKKKKTRGRREDVRWFRTLYFTVVDFIGYGITLLLYGWFQETYLPQFLISWIWLGWNWFFWPAVICFWLEEIIGPDFNIWPKGLTTAYSGIFIGSLIMAVLALVTGHDFYLKETKGFLRGEQKIEAKIQALEKELAESLTPPKAFDDDGFSSGDGFVSPEKRSAWVISLELQKIKAKKAAKNLTSSPHSSAVTLRFWHIFDWLWWGIIEWFPTYLIAVLILGPIYGIDALTHRNVQLLDFFFRRRRR